MGFIIETKHCGGYEPMDAIVTRYQPQLQWQMIVTGARRAALSVIMGAKEPVVEWVDFDEDYARELMSRAKQFMQCVFNLTPPVVLEPVAAPVKAEKLYDMTGKNEWAAEAATWLETREARKKNEAADKAIKALVPPDAAKCIGHCIQVSRSKSGSLSIRELKE